MNKRRIELSNITSDRLVRLLEKWPLSRLPTAKTIAEHQTFSAINPHPYRLPLGDTVSLRVASFSIVVPIERRLLLLESLRRMLRKYADGIGHHIRFSSQAPDFDTHTVFHGSWYRLGSCAVDPSLNIGADYLDICILRDCESFIICTFNVLPDDNMKYEFSKIMRNQFNEKIVLHPTLRHLFRHWAMTFYMAEHVFLHELHAFLDRTRRKFRSFTQTKRYCVFYRR